jgi:hypothetical protein
MLTGSIRECAERAMLVLEWLTFVSATIAAVFQGRRAVQGWLYDQQDRRELRRVQRAGWSRGGVDTWTVRPADPDPSDRPATVTIEVCDRNGNPSPVQADRLRRYLQDHNHLSRNPTPAELETLEAAGRETGELAMRRPRRWRPVVWRPGRP